MTLKQYPLVGESLYETQLPNGLRIRLIPKKDFARKQAFLAVDFGSVDTRFVANGTEHCVPDGIAHYLEHKMFDMPNEDANALFARWGASVNAFTSYTMTAYYFLCSEYFEECLSLLLRMVTTPYFTEESVEKERGIIEQEILMYEDSAESRISEDLFRIMFPHHTVQIPIAGTVESISHITADMLYDCHKTFYHPCNMILCVAGDIPIEQIVSIAEASTPVSPAPVLTRSYGRAPILTEPQTTSRSMDISMPTFGIGFSCPPPAEGESCMYRELLGELAAEILAGEASTLYNRLYEEGLVDGALYVGYESIKDACLLSISGDSPKPDKVYEAILTEARRLAVDGYDEAEFNRLLRSFLGRRIRELDSFFSICYRICAYEFEDYEFFTFPAEYSTVTLPRVLEFLAAAVCRNHSAMAVVLPVEDTV